MNRKLALGLAMLTTTFAVAQTPAPPKTWVDKDTGHRVWRLTDEPGSSAFYFNVNAYTPDDKYMVYTAPDGIHTLELATRKTRLVVPNPPPPANASATTMRGRYSNHAVVVGHKTDSIFFTRLDAVTNRSVVYKADLVSGAVTKLATLPERASIATVNADETLAAGTYDESPADQAKDYGRNGSQPATGKEAERPALFQPENKGEMMERRLASRIPLVLFTVELNGTDKTHTLLHSTDWVNHLLFSPADPTLLMYCHEGPWQKVDRIWTIRTDGTHNELMHHRTMLMEIAGHEFWGIDGETVYYDWQLPKGEDFWLAGFDVATRKRFAFHMQRNEWSIHFNVNRGATLFTGDGGDSGQVAHAPDGQWIELFHPEATKNNGGLDEPQFIKPGVFRSEKLVNMKHHNYRLEPNVRFSPDAKLVIFTSNMFGPSYVFAAEVDKASPSATDIESTPDLGRRFGPDPLPTNCTGNKGTPCNVSAK